MCSITETAENLREATAMLSRNAQDMTPHEMYVSLKMVNTLAEVLKQDVDDMNHINALHEYYLANSQWAEGLQVEID
jgi:hypothetical protein